MKWSREAQEAMSKVPFFVRKRVKKRVEEEAARSGAMQVGMEHVNACRRRFLESMEDEVRGYQLENCFGAGSCPNRALEEDGLPERLQQVLERKNLKAFLKERVKGPLKIHHEFRVAISDCPNACSHPQIVDVGLIGASRPTVTIAPCTDCGACLNICREEAINIVENAGGPHIDEDRCLGCGQCIHVCPSGTLKEERKGYRVLLGGKLGRHPQLGRELPGIYSGEQVLEVVERCVDHYLKHNVAGERFGEVIEREGITEILENE